MPGHGVAERFTNREPKRIRQTSHLLDVEWDGDGETLRGRDGTDRFESKGLTL